MFTRYSRKPKIDIFEIFVKNLVHSPSHTNPNSRMKCLRLLSGNDTKEYHSFPKLAWDEVGEVVRVRGCQKYVATPSLPGRPAQG